jgi:hypothetical protein
MHPGLIIGKLRVMVFNATFNTILVISWRSILLGEAAGVPRENHLPAVSRWRDAYIMMTSGIYTLTSLSLNETHSHYTL